MRTKKQQRNKQTKHLKNKNKQIQDEQTKTIQNMNTNTTK